MQLNCLNSRKSLFQVTLIRSKNSASALLEVLNIDLLKHYKSALANTGVGYIMFPNNPHLTEQMRGEKIIHKLHFVGGKELQTQQVRAQSCSL